MNKDPWKHASDEFVKLRDENRKLKMQHLVMYAVLEYRKRQGDNLASLAINRVEEYEITGGEKWLEEQVEKFTNR